MSALRKISSAFISVWHKENLDKITGALNNLGIQIYSTGGTAGYIEKSNVPVIRVESITGYPSILGGRVKTLHPKVFGGILARRNIGSDIKELEEFGIPPVDLVVTDLYPFEDTVTQGAPDQEIIEKIDIGGIALIRAAAKNFNDVLIIPSRDHYPALLEILLKGEGSSTLEERMEMAGEAFRISSSYDTAIYSWFTGKDSSTFTPVFRNGRKLRYGENPHQNAVYYLEGEFPFRQLHGKEISYNNLLDIDAACQLIAEFDETTFAILKHNNACGLASADILRNAYTAALAGDPVSAFGGVLVANRKIDEDTATEMNKLFFEVAIAPEYSNGALGVLKSKKNRIILVSENVSLPDRLIRSVTGGLLVQDRDTHTESESGIEVVTQTSPDRRETTDLLFANKIVKHTKSNAIVLAKDKQLIGSGGGQTSRVDALKQAIEKAVEGGFDLNGAVMASDAFFPFADSVEIAGKAGITAVIQPGGSVRDKASIDFCNDNGMKMVFTGIRHFRH